MITLNEFLWLVIILALCVSSLYKQKQLEEELEKLKDDRQ